MHLHLEEMKRVPDLDLSNAASALQSELRYQLTDPRLINFFEHTFPWRVGKHL